MSIKHEEEKKPITSGIRDTTATLCIIKSDEDCIIAAPGTCLKCLEVKLGCEILKTHSLNTEQLKEWQNIKLIGAENGKNANSRLKIRGCSTKCECKMGPSRAP